MHISAAGAALLPREERLLLSVAQFRPEKDHAPQLQAHHAHTALSHRSLTAPPTRGRPRPSPRPRRPGPRPRLRPARPEPEPEPEPEPTPRQAFALLLKRWTAEGASPPRRRSWSRARCATQPTRRASTRCVRRRPSSGCARAATRSVGSRRARGLVGDEASEEGKKERGPHPSCVRTSTRTHALTLLPRPHPLALTPRPLALALQLNLSRAELRARARRGGGATMWNDTSASGRRDDGGGRAAHRARLRRLRARHRRRAPRPWPRAACGGGGRARGGRVCSWWGSCTSAQQYADAMAALLLEPHAEPRRRAMATAARASVKALLGGCVLRRLRASLAPALRMIKRP